MDVPSEFVTVGDVHAGTNGRLIIHVQDAHSNASGQANLAAALDRLMRRYRIPVVFVEGGDRDVTLDEVKKIARPEDWGIVAKRLLQEGAISGEEYLNLVSDHPMRLYGIEYPELYESNVETYAELVGKRREILGYLREIRAAAERVKNRLYPEPLRAYEETKRKSADGALKALLKLAASAGLAPGPDYPELEALTRVEAAEKTIDFNRANAEQAALFGALASKIGAEEVQGFIEAARRTKNAQVAQYLLYVSIFGVAEAQGISVEPFGELAKYRDYLKGFADLRLDRVLEETERLEAAVYDRLLENADLKKLRGIDRYLALLESAHAIRMSSREFALYRASRPSFETRSWQAFLNGKLKELGYLEDLVAYRPELDAAEAAIERFYEIVDRRDAAFLENAGRILAERNERAAFLISGGYHTEHLVKLLREAGYSYMVLTPVVGYETDLKKYEEMLLAPLEARRDRAPEEAAPARETARFASGPESAVRVAALVTAGSDRIDRAPVGGGRIDRSALSTAVENTRTAREPTVNRPDVTRAAAPVESVAPTAAPEELPAPVFLGARNPEDIRRDIQALLIAQNDRVQRLADRFGLGRSRSTGQFFTEPLDDPQYDNDPEVQAFRADRDRLGLLRAELAAATLMGRQTPIVERPADFRRLATDLGLNETTIDEMMQRLSPAGARAPGTVSLAYFAWPPETARDAAAAAEKRIATLRQEQERTPNLARKKTLGALIERYEALLAAVQRYAADPKAPDTDVELVFLLRVIPYRGLDTIAEEAAAGWSWWRPVTVFRAWRTARRIRKAVSAEKQRRAPAVERRDPAEVAAELGEKLVEASQNRRLPPERLKAQARREAEDLLARGELTAEDMEKIDRAIEEFARIVDVATGRGLIPYPCSGAYARRQPALLFFLLMSNGIDSSKLNRALGLFRFYSRRDDGRRGGPRTYQSQDLAFSKDLLDSLAGVIGATAATDRGAVTVAKENALNELKGRVLIANLRAAPKSLRNTAYVSFLMSHYEMTDPSWLYGRFGAETVRKISAEIPAAELLRIQTHELQKLHAGSQSTAETRARLETLALLKDRGLVPDGDELRTVTIEGKDGQPLRILSAAARARPQVVRPTVARPPKPGAPRKPKPDTVAAVTDDTAVASATELKVGARISNPAEIARLLRATGVPGERIPAAIRYVAQNQAGDPEAVIEGVDPAALSAVGRVFQTAGIVLPADAALVARVEAEFAAEERLAGEQRRLEAVRAIRARLNGPRFRADPTLLRNTEIEESATQLTRWESEVRQSREFLSRAAAEGQRSPYDEAGDVLTAIGALRTPFESELGRRQALLSPNEAVFIDAVLTALRTRNPDLARTAFQTDTLPDLAPRDLRRYLTARDEYNIARRDGTFRTDRFYLARQMALDAARAVWERLPAEPLLQGAFLQDLIDRLADEDRLARLTRESRRIEPGDRLQRGDANWFVQESEAGQALMVRQLEGGALSTRPEDRTRVSLAVLRSEIAAGRLFFLPEGGRVDTEAEAAETIPTAVPAAAAVTTLVAPDAFPPLAQTVTPDLVSNITAPRELALLARVAAVPGFRAGGATVYLPYDGVALGITIATPDLTAGTLAAVPANGVPVDLGISRKRLGALVAAGTPVSAALPSEIPAALPGPEIAMPELPGIVALDRDARRLERTLALGAELFNAARRDRPAPVTVFHSLDRYVPRAAYADGVLTPELADVLKSIREAAELFQTRGVTLQFRASDALSGFLDAAEAALAAAPSEATRENLETLGWFAARRVDDVYAFAAGPGEALALNTAPDDALIRRALEENRNLGAAANNSPVAYGLGDPLESLAQFNTAQFMVENIAMVLIASVQGESPAEVIVSSKEISFFENVTGRRATGQTLYGLRNGLVSAQDFFQKVAIGFKWRLLKAIDAGLRQQLITKFANDISA
jgi:hypothetical protein